MSKANDEQDPRPAASGRGSSAVSGTKTGTASAGQRRSRRAADAPVDAEVRTTERVSLARARDREALRTYRALAEHSVPTVATSYDAMPTRRQLRLQQQEAQAARAGAPTAAAGGTVPRSSTPAASTPTSSTPGNSGPGSAAQAPTDAAASGTGTAPAPTGAQPAEGRPLHPDGTPIERRIAQVPLEGRRDRRRRVSTEGEGAAGPRESGTAPAAGQGAAGEDLSVEQALAAREAIAAQARDQVAMIEAAQGTDPFAVDPAILAKQKALAERAAVLNSRAQKIQQLSEENSQRRPQSSDPTTAHNLSIVAPPEYVSVPGVGGPVLKAPTTSHVPVVPRPVPSKPSTPAPAPTGKGPERRSQVLAQAETLARSHGRATDDGATPVRAQSAHGLDPLDAMTAGLARVRRMRYLQFSILGLGVLALLAGILMIVSGLGG